MFKSRLLFLSFLFLFFGSGLSRSSYPLQCQAINQAIIAPPFVYRYPSLHPGKEEGKKETIKSLGNGICVADKVLTPDTWPMHAVKYPLKTDVQSFVFLKDFVTSFHLGQASRTTPNKSSNADYLKFSI